MTGTVINFIAIILGGTLGTFLGARLPERVRETVMHGLGLLVFVIGLQMTLATHNDRGDSFEAIADEIEALPVIAHDPGWLARNFPSVAEANAKATRT